MRQELTFGMDVQDFSKLPTPTSRLASPSPPQGPLHSISDSVQVTAQHDAVVALKTRLASLTEHFDAIEARLDGLVSKQAIFEITLNTIVESQKVEISTITVLTEKLDLMATCFENITPIPPQGAFSTGCVD